MPANRHRAYLTFMHNDGWHCAFLESDAKTSLPKKLAFANPAKIIEMAHRAGALPDLAARQALDHGIEIGRGGFWMDLSDEQYLKLKVR